MRKSTRSQRILNMVLDKKSNAVTSTQSIDDLMEIDQHSLINEEYSSESYIPSDTVSSSSNSEDILSDKQEQNETPEKLQEYQQTNKSISISPISNISTLSINNSILDLLSTDAGLSTSDLINKSKPEASCSTLNDNLSTNETSNIEVKKRVRSKDFCFYCESLVLNFARHLFRNHILETEVQKILSKPKNSKDRKDLLTKLRKKGNYIQNAQNCIKPMKKTRFSGNGDYLPCTSCLGFYKRRNLWKHRKYCAKNDKNSSAQSNAQNFLVRNLDVDTKLRELIFPHMRADSISLVAKTDNLICAFGSQYLKIHREKHFQAVTSRKMREVAKLLIELRKKEPQIKNLFDALKPQYYDLLVNSTKLVAKYDLEKNVYESPTYAMNISTSIKNCCNIAMMQTLKQKQSVQTAEIKADLKTLIELIEANWRFDVSSQAADDLNLKKWNKITIVPLATDLRLLKNYLCKISKIATDSLKKNNYDVEAYKNLLESIYCRVLLLNRRRPGELQRLLIDTYDNTEDKGNKYEEFDRALSTTEKILIHKFKRVVIRGKRGRGVAVLFSLDVQMDINTLKSVRDKYILKSNRFLFAKPNCNTPIYGYKVIEKHAKLCGAKNPKAITSTRLRKHLATLTQIFNMNDGDIEQLANFMGHTSAVHKNSYRLPDDVYQTAKLSKLLLLMEDGKADEYKGKSLDNIDLDMDEEILGENLENDDLLDNVDVDLKLLNSNLSQTNTTSISHQSDILKDVSNTNQTKKKKKRILVPWSQLQKEVVLKYFDKHITCRKPPKRHECETLIERNSKLLQNKDWMKIKVFVQNIYSKNK